VTATPSQTVGPFFSIGMEPVAGSDGVPVRGVVYDGEGVPIPDAVVEAWQPERFARSHTDDDGRYELVVAPAPFADVSVFARGLLQRLATRVCLSEDALPDVPRRETLLAAPDGEDGFVFDIRLQGPRETVFFAL
jgi:protocatechuate 3,4-dioxygenase alpha subunit